MSRKPFKSEHLQKTQEDSDDFDDHAVLGNLDGPRVSEVFERQFVFDSVAASANSSSIGCATNQSLPFDPTWAVDSFIQTADCIEKSLRNCIIRLSMPAFDVLEIELRNTVVPSIWDVNFGVNIKTASVQQHVRNEAILSCFSIERELSLVKGNLRSLVLLTDRVNSDQLTRPFKSVGDSLCAAHSHCESLLVDRGASCKALARALRLDKLVATLGAFISGLPTPSSNYDMERSLTAARKFLDLASTTLAAPPFSGSHTNE